MKKPLSKFATLVLVIPRLSKRLLAMAVDVGLCILTVWIAFYLRLGDFISFLGASPWASGATLAATVSVAIAFPIFVFSGFYRVIFRYSGSTALLSVARSIGLYGLLYVLIITVWGMPDVPRTVGIIQPILLLIFVALSRLIVTAWLGSRYRDRSRRVLRSKVLIYGAGHTGRQLALAMNSSQEMQFFGFLDDDPRLQGYLLNNRPVYAPADLEEIVLKHDVGHVLLAMPRLSRQRRNEIIERMRYVNVAVRTLPSVTDLAKGRVTISVLRELDIDDILGRAPVEPDARLLSKNITHKIVLVTGAGGSIGSELCRQILALEPQALLLVEQSEFALYAIHQELVEQYSGSCRCELVPLLASVQDLTRMQEIMGAWHPATVYHAAAYKHVPLVEHNPVEGIRNNVFGTLCVAKAAQENRVSDFVLISTDKAVRPTNIMGASKRLAEMVLQAIAEQSDSTQFCMVRFGNVLGSSGSVVPKFRRQIRDGGPVTLTHSEVTRFFMTIPEAAQLVIQAGAMAQGGDVFVLDMGESVRIYDLAQRMIELSGLTIKDAANPWGDIEIEVTGLRPGEKLFEELLIGDNPEPTAHARIMKAREAYLCWSDLAGYLEALESSMVAGDGDAIRGLMQHLVTGFVPASENVDWITLQRAST